MQNKKLNLLCFDTPFEIRISPVSYDFYKDGILIAVIYRFWREDTPKNENSELEGFKIEIIGKLTDEQRLLVLAMLILRLDFDIDEVDCIT